MNIKHLALFFAALTITAAIPEGPRGGRGGDGEGRLGGPQDMFRRAAALQHAAGEESSEFPRPDGPIGGERKEILRAALQELAESSEFTEQLQRLQAQHPDHDYLGEIGAAFEEMLESGEFTGPERPPRGDHEEMMRAALQELAESSEFNEQLQRLREQHGDDDDHLDEVRAAVEEMIESGEFDGPDGERVNAIKEGIQGQLGGEFPRPGPQEGQSFVEIRPSSIIKTPMVKPRRKRDITDAAREAARTIKRTILKLFGRNKGDKGNVKDARSIIKRLLRGNFRANKGIVKNAVKRVNNVIRK